jgi:outer membrane protein OmpA-like peptidoglycan-associated protein
VLFDFNEATLTSQATGHLVNAADCLKTLGAMVKAVGHADRVEPKNP